MLRAVESSFVTIMFTDVVGSTTLYDRYGDDEADAQRARHFAMLREVVASHEGREVKSTGDGLMVTFTSAVAAVRCAVAMQRATTGATDGLEVRIGIDVGEPLSERGALSIAIERAGARGRYKALPGALRRATTAGAHRLTFRARLRGRPLRVGRYRLVLRAIDAAGNRSAARRLRFTVAAGR